MTDSGFIVRGSNTRPIGCVIVGRGVAANLFAAWTKAGKVGEFDTAAEAIDAVRKASFLDRKEEKQK